MAKNEDFAEELKKKFAEKKIVLGLNETKRKLLSNKLEKIILAKNISDEIKEELERKCKLAGVKVEISEFSNEELGVLCKKQFFVSVLGVLK